ncbi:hypothetical protein EJ03DRAFT_134137 [Teratosphaeria nubilosa]|uniref:Uncharacterized protein n=1 Tax=Teratosphaeria nubilosa TaxID=161662 RepID=A0A6G1L6I4_9PEZI|nr:hypothetical protein EJ03DRAFT_134137 [Teratosphaeria nubilosa]
MCNLWTRVAGGMDQAGSLGGMQARPHGSGLESGKNTHIHNSGGRGKTRCTTDAAPPQSRWSTLRSSSGEMTRPTSRNTLGQTFFTPIEHMQLEALQTPNW